MNDCIAVVSDLVFAGRITGTAGKLGTTCRVVRTLVELETALATDAPALVLVDMDAEEASLDDCIRAVKSKHPGSWVVAFFSHTRTELKQRARAAGADEVIPRSLFVERLPHLLSRDEAVADRFRNALERIDAANAEDPRSEVVDGEPRPRELLFARRVYEWVTRLVDEPSESLLLAARGHTIRRWMIPRDQYPRTTEGYHAWRNALAEFHAGETAKILTDLGYDQDTLDQVTALITKTNWPGDAEARALEDADCLVFLETKLQAYVDDWGEGKTVRILRSTIAKMTPDGRQNAKRLTLADRERKLLEQAMS